MKKMIWDGKKIVRENISKKEEEFILDIIANAIEKIIKTDCGPYKESIVLSYVKERLPKELHEPALDFLSTKFVDFDNISVFAYKEKQGG